MKTSLTRKECTGWDLYGQLIEGIPEEAEVQDCLIEVHWMLVRSTGLGISMTPPEGDRNMRHAGFNPQIGTFYSPSGDTVIHAAVSKKTRMPSIKDKSSYRLGYAIPNPDLDPEGSINYEAGYQSTFFKKLFLKATVFHNDIGDYILTATVPDPDSPGTTIGQNQNIGEVSQYGAEIEISGSLLDSLEGGVNYTCLRVNNKATSDELTGIPGNQAGAYLRYSPVTTLSALVDVQYASRRYSSSNGVRVAKAYTVADVKPMWESLTDFILETGIGNVFDREYALDEGYPLPGRSCFANVRYRFWEDSP